MMQSIFFKEMIRIDLKEEIVKYICLYNNYSKTRNLIGQQPCRITQSCTENSECFLTGFLKCRQKNKIM